MTLFAMPEGATSLEPEEQHDLIPDLATREELNEWERQNILEAYRWALAPRNLKRASPLTEDYVRTLHRRMFSQTWRWAGRYRTTQKNIGIPHHAVRDALAVLLGDLQAWLDFRTYSPDEIAIRFHHRLVFIHPFPNGNGRHARLLADVLARRQGCAAFSWGSGSIVGTGPLRKAYLDGLRAADRGDISLLLLFARK